MRLAWTWAGETLRPAIAAATEADRLTVGGAGWGTPLCPPPPPPGEGPSTLMGCRALPPAVTGCLQIEEKKGTHE